MPGEVAVFIDLENLRYGMLKNYGQEPDIQSIVEKARKYGRPSVMRAYADFSEHPEDVKRQLEVAGVEAINVMVKRSLYLVGQQQRERVKNAADMVLALDAVMEALEADSNQKQKVFLLVTGDADYVKLVTLLRNRFGQRVVISADPSWVARALVTAAGEEDPIVVPGYVPADAHTLKSAIVAMVKKGPAPLTYWTLKIIDQWSQDRRNGIPGTTKQRRDAIGELVREQVLVRREIDLGQKGTATQIVLDENRARELQYVD